MNEKRCLVVVEEMKYGLPVEPVAAKPNVYECPEGHRSIFVPDPGENDTVERPRRSAPMTTEEAIDLVKNGGGLILDAEQYTTEDLIRIARKAAERGGDTQIHLLNSTKRSAAELIEIVRAGNGTVMFHIA
jgi:hypothetical protein